MWDELQGYDVTSDFISDLKLTKDLTDQEFGELKLMFQLSGGKISNVK